MSTFQHLTVYATVNSKYPTWSSRVFKGSCPQFNAPQNGTVYIFAIIVRVVVDNPAAGKLNMLTVLYRYL